MRLPDFLIVGAMKAGTTTLYHDLAAHPRVFMSTPKEPESLCWDAVLSPEGRAEYMGLFARAQPEQICGEASVMYTGYGHADDAAARAREVLVPSTAIIYVVREPIARIRSAHRMFVHEGTSNASIDQAVRENPRYLEESRYAARIKPWIEAFGASQVHIVRFEDYVADRRSVVSALWRALGLRPRPRRIDSQRIHNQSLVDTPPPSPETVTWILRELGDDLAELHTMLGRTEPMWPQIDRRALMDV